MRFSRNVLHSITPAFTVLSRRLMFDHACCLPRERQTGRLAICCVPIPPWVVIVIRAFSGGDPDGSARGRGGRRRRGVGALLRDHIGFAAFSAGSPLGRNVEAALRPRPRLRQRVFDSLDSLLWIRGKVPLAKLRNNRHPRITAPTPAAPGYTERPARVQFMLGRVGLYIDAICYINRPDSKRPQALKSRVVRAKRSGCRHCRPCAKRSGYQHC